MTKALDAAIQAGCVTAFGEQCRYPDCQCVVVRRMTNEMFRAALPAEPTPRMLEAIARHICEFGHGHNPDKFFIDQSRWAWFESDAEHAYRAIRTHLLGDDA